MFTATGFSQQDIVKDGLLVWLDANDKTSYPGTGTLWRDLSKTYSSGSLDNGTTYNTPNGGYFLFDGSDDKITLTDSSFAIGTSDFTVDIYCYRNSATANFYSGIMGQGGTDGTIGINITDRTCWVGSSGVVNGIGNNSFKNFTDNKWIHVIFQRQTVGGTTTYSLKQDTVDVLTPTTYGSALSINGTSIVLGQRYYNNFGFPWGGYLASYKFYNRALTQSEILQNYNALKSRFGL